jgi:hypothetical protein
MQNELQLAYQNGTIDDLIALATKHPAEMRNQIYQQAAWKATNVGDTARANQIAMELISDEAQRRQLLEQVRNQKIWQALNENRIDEAKALLDDSIGVEQKVYILMQLASMLSGKDKQREAIACLDEGLALLQTVPRNSSRMNREIELAGSYSLVDPKQSFALLESIAKQLNELVVAAVVVDGFDNTYLKNGEWMVNGSSSLANIFTSMRRSVGQFAGVDFDQAQVLAAQFERPEMRLMAQLEVARTVLVQQKVNVGVRGRYRVWRN